MRPDRCVSHRIHIKPRSVSLFLLYLGDRRTCWITCWALTGRYLHDVQKVIRPETESWDQDQYQLCPQSNQAQEGNDISTNMWVSMVRWRPRYRVGQVHWDRLHRVNQHIVLFSALNWISLFGERANFRVDILSCDPIIGRDYLVSLWFDISFDAICISVPSRL